MPVWSQVSITSSRSESIEMNCTRSLAFAVTRPGDPKPERSLYKDVLGTTLVFEETRRDLGLRMRVTWQTSSRFGVVRACELASLGDLPVDVDEEVRRVVPVIEAVRGMTLSVVPASLTATRTVVRSWPTSSEMRRPS